MRQLELAEEAVTVRERAHPEDPDRDVVELVGAGRTDAALRLLMERHGTAVYRYCREELRDAALADDVHQQVFVQVHRDLPRFAGRATVRTWLFAIARNRVLDAAKARRRATAYIEHDDTADAPDLTPSPDEQIDDVRLVQMLVHCVARLPAAMRTAVLLRYQQGFTFAEMARICGEKPGTLQARVTRALPLLRKCIEATTAGSL
ncbi:MAG TPA: sigma-70 family RNA polymerase sigma factor [Kofleriaceae bacterium]|nr:sigma-70 family RNA polymerase sigma factor [Kofleriaceae bacterium]